jgi:tRNA-guanine family transglycosylase
LFASGEMLGTRLATMHNLRFYLNLMQKVHHAIQYDFMTDFATGFRDLTAEK